MRFRLATRLVLLPLALGARLVAQRPDTARRELATVSGVVHDSVGHAPLAGAVVQLVSADAPMRFGVSTTADSLGHFALDGIPDGNYLIGFFHPLLDSLGLQSLTHEIVVAGHRDLRADLAIPSPARLRTAICGPAADSGGVAVGRVLDARDGAPIVGASVGADWLEISFTAQGIVRRTPHVAATTRDDGWFALCDLPSGGTMLLRATHGADSTDRIEVRVPAEGFVRRLLYVGGADGTRGVRFAGTVVAAAGGTPLVGANVTIARAAPARAGANGEWTLAGAPAGTRVLEVRAVGYYPERRVVDVIAGASPVRVALSTVKAVLDTIRVTAARTVDPLRTGFESRRRASAGRFVTPDAIARRAPVVTSDLFRNMIGVEMVGDSLYMNGPFGRCLAAIYIDGRYFEDMTANDIDTWVRPNEVAGIEVYSEATAPPQFRSLSGKETTPCGSIVIWRK